MATNFPPGGIALLVKNRAAFTQRYGGAWPVMGEYDGNLSNGGENLLLLDCATNAAGCDLRN